MGCGVSCGVVQSGGETRCGALAAAAAYLRKPTAPENCASGQSSKSPCSGTTSIDDTRGKKSLSTISHKSCDSTATGIPYLSKLSSIEFCPGVTHRAHSELVPEPVGSAKRNQTASSSLTCGSHHSITDFQRTIDTNSEGGLDTKGGRSVYGNGCRCSSVMSNSGYPVSILSPVPSRCSKDFRFVSPRRVNRLGSASLTCADVEHLQRRSWGGCCSVKRLSGNARMSTGAISKIDTPTSTNSALGRQYSSCAGHRQSFLAGDCGCSCLFYDPCEKCGRSILDTEVVHRCDVCVLVFCADCYEERGEALHEHQLTSFKRAVNNDVTDSFLVNKGRNTDGNKVINEYVVIKLLGRGSHAKVNLVQHHQDRTFHALKILRRDQGKKVNRGIVSRSSTFDDDDLLREIAVMKFVSHPNLVKLKEVIDDVESHRVYVIMEYCAKGPVHIHGNPPLAPEKVRKYACDILSGLLQLHAQYLYHWDVKPANCLVDDNDVAKVADFGACGRSTRTAKVGGTPAYSCPEQFAGAHTAGDVADSWAFAMTLYQMSHGTLAYSTNSITSLRNSMLDPTPLPIKDSVGPELKDLLRRMLHKDLPKRMLLYEAMRHPYFSEYMPPSPVSTTQSNGGGGCSAAELYARAQQAVLRGKRVEDCFHGVQAIRRMRRMMVHHITTHDVDDDEDMFSEDPEAPSLESTQRLVANEAETYEVQKIVNGFVDDAVRRALRIDGIFMPTLHSFVGDAAPLAAKLCCVNNKLSYVGPVDFSAFKYLRVVQLSENSLKTFPVEVLQAPKLCFLNLSHNLIKEIPPALLRAPELHTLCMNHNQVGYVGCDDTGASVLSGPSMQKVVLTANPLRELPAKIATCSKLELMLDDAPALLEEWYTLINQSASVSITWNDIYPCRVYSEVPLFIASKSIKLYNLTILEALDARNVVLTQFEPWLPAGEVGSKAMEESVRRHQLQAAKANVNGDDCTMRSPNTRKMATNSGEHAAVPNILSKSVSRFLHSYFVVEEDPLNRVYAYDALKHYVSTCLSINESVVVFLDERRESQATRDTIVAVMCEVLMTARGGKTTLSGCISDVVDAIRGLYA